MEGRAFAQMRFDHPVDDRQIAGFGASAGDRRMLDRAGELVLRQILDRRQRRPDLGLGRRGRGLGRCALRGIVLSLRVRRPPAVRPRAKARTCAPGARSPLSAARPARASAPGGSAFGGAPGFGGGGVSGVALASVVLSGDFAVDLLLGRRRGRVVGRLFVLGLGRRLRLLLRRLGGACGGGCSITTSTGISSTGVGILSGQSQ